MPTLTRRSVSGPIASLSPSHARIDIRSSNGTIEAMGIYPEPGQLLNGPRGVRLADDSKTPDRTSFDNSYSTQLRIIGGKA